MKMRNLITLVLTVLIFAGLTFTGCEKTEEIDSTSDSPGKLKILLTDAPFPTDMVAEANVVINKIEIRKANEDEDEGENEGENEDEGYPFVTLAEEEMHFNLLELTNGVTAEMVDIEIESGAYDLVRLYVADASIMLKDSTEYDLKVPSGAQTGIKIFIDPAVEVMGGLTAELILDFNVSKSFVVQGNPNTPAGIKGFIFKPVIKASNESTAGRLMGTVTDTGDVAIEGAEVSVLAADTVYTSSFSDEAGAYQVIGIHSGAYHVAFAKEGFISDTIKDVDIYAGNATVLDIQLTPVEEEEGDGEEGNGEGEEGDGEEGDGDGE